jgi:hypothetical protein
MSKIRFASLASTVVLATMLSACGSRGSPSGTTVTPSGPSGDNPPTQPQTIEGIAMPSSVSVVTATNAQ